ncbi:hypothetical protein [Novipirellula caenicola]
MTSRLLESGKWKHGNGGNATQWNPPIQVHRLSCPTSQLASSEPH